jgi:hypothetical protein
VDISSHQLRFRDPADHTHTPAPNPSATPAQSPRDHQEDIENHNTCDAGASRTDRHADADLPAALEYGGGENRIEGDAGEEQRNGGKESGKRGDTSLAKSELDPGTRVGLTASGLE